MATDPQTQLLHDRFLVIPHELRELLVSSELPRKIGLISRKHNLTADQERILQNEITFVLLILDSIDNLPLEITEGLKVPLETAESLSRDIENYILMPVIDLLAHDHGELVMEEGPEENPSVGSSSLQDSAVHPIDHNSNFSKDSILREIENPQKTTLKKYSIEYDHQPLQDTTHLIEDKVDETLKLQDHYTD